LATLKGDRPNLSPAHVWRAYAHLDAFKGDTVSTQRNLHRLSR
jgi:hypothetical protein